MPASLPAEQRCHPCKQESSLGQTAGEQASTSRGCGARPGRRRRRLRWRQQRRHHQRDLRRRPDLRDGADTISLGLDAGSGSLASIGTDLIEAGAGDDRLVVIPTSGQVAFDGGAGRDTITLQPAPNGWTPDTLKLSAPGMSWARDAAGDIVFTGPASGTITWGDTVVTFTNVEKIEMPRR
jgi:hypothetical protein